MGWWGGLDVGQARRDGCTVKDALLTLIHPFLDPFLLDGSHWKQRHAIFVSSGSSSKNGCSTTSNSSNGYAVNWSHCCHQCRLLILLRKSNTSEQSTILPTAWGSSIVSVVLVIIVEINIKPLHSHGVFILKWAEKVILLSLPTEKAVTLGTQTSKHV